MMPSFFLSLLMFPTLAVANLSFDANGNPLAETNARGFTTTFDYDGLDRSTRRTDPTGTTVYGFDALNRLVSLTAPGRGAVNYRYTAAGLVTGINHPDGTETEQTHDPVGRIATITHLAAGSRQAFYRYEYDANGNRTRQIEDLGSGEVETTYQYDAADRLIESARAGRTTTYTLDPVGNRVEEVTTQNAITTVKTLEYNTRDRLKSLNLQGAPPEVQWQYDDAGFRVAETTPSEARRFRWDGERLSFETNILGNVLARYDHGPDRLLAETESGQTRTWLTDVLQTPVKRLNEDGSVYSTTRYDEFGLVEEETSPDTPRFGFTGHQRGPEQEPDLYYAQQRWYNAATGRFISEDPLLGSPTNPPSLHRYLYAFANPLVFVDPDGRCPLAALDICDQVVADELGVDLGTREGARALSEFRFNQVVGGAEIIGEGIAGTIDLAALLVNANLETISGGLLDFGARRSIDAGVESAAGFLRNPLETIRQGLNDHTDRVKTLREAGEFGELGRITGRRNTAVGLTLASLSSALRPTFRKGSPKGALVREAQDAGPRRPTRDTLSQADLNAPFETFGFNADPLSFPNGERLVTRLRNADRSAPRDRINQRARDLFRSGVEAPRVSQVKPGERLIKLVPKGDSPTPFTPFFISEAEFQRLMRSGGNIADQLGLPSSNSAKVFDVFAIEPKPGQTPTIFKSTVAPTRQGSVHRPGGVEQTLVPERYRFADPTLIGEIGERL